MNKNGNSKGEEDLIVELSSVISNFVTRQADGDGKDEEGVSLATVRTISTSLLFLSAKTCALLAHASVATGRAPSREEAVKPFLISFTKLVAEFIDVLANPESHEDLGPNAIKVVEEINENIARSSRVANTAKSCIDSIMQKARGENQ